MPEMTSLDSTDGDWPRMVALFRNGREIAAVGAADAEDAARQVAILVLQRTEGLRVGDEVRVSRI
jgi:hypothetical protein